MAIQYHMRAYNTTLSKYVDWVVNDAPDSTGLYSGYQAGQLTNITVNRIVQSKVNNALKITHGLGGADGYFYHINSYDWKNVTPPIGVPTSLVGLAVERGITLQAGAAGTINGATNTAPIQITTTGAHGLSTGQYVTIVGVLGNIGANGTYPITVTGTNSFTLTGSAGTGTYTSGGNVYLPNDFSTLTWDETNQIWRFVLNTKGDGTTLGTSQNMRALSAKLDGYAVLGSLNNPASQGIIRLPNNQFMFGRNATNTNDVQLIGLDSLNRIKFGNTTSDLCYYPGAIILDGYMVHAGAGTNVALTGFIREQNNTTIVAFRNSTGTSDIAALSSTGANLIVLGDAVNSGINYNTSPTNVHSFQTGSVSFLDLGALNGAAPFNTSAFLRFSQGAASPVVGQTSATSGSGATLTVQAQATTANSQTGGILQLASGRGSGAGAFDGAVDIFTGTPANGGTRKIRINPTFAPVAADSNSIQIFENKIRFDVGQVLPRIMQDDITTTSAVGQSLYVQAQNATGASATGGNLVLSAGTGTANPGNVIIQTGNQNQIIVSPTSTTILGNLLVNGTTTSISSTVVEIADRVINLNSSANQFPGTTVPAPTQITGFAIDRGSINPSTKRDYYGLFWSENDGYWRFGINTDGYTTQNALSGTLPTLASAYMAQPSASVPVDAAKIPTVGGFRTLNNTVALASRNSTSSQDLVLVSTDATNHLIWGAGTQNAGHIFNTTVGTIYDFQVSSVSTYTITPVSGGTTTLQATSGVTTLVYNHATTGSASGAPTVMQAQSAATNGGNLILSSGRGSGVSTDGYVGIETGNVDRIKVFYDHSEFRDASEALRITPVSSGTTQITYASTVTAAQINQTTTASTSGAPMTVQAQNAATTGGNLVLTSGTGTTAGDLKLQTGAVDRVIVHPSFTEFRDTAEAVRITPVSAGTTQFTFNNTVTSVVFNQTATSGTTGAPWTIQAQAGASGTGGNLTLIAGNATTTGGNVIITSGTGTTAGDVKLQTGAVDRVVVHPTFTEFRDTAEAYRIIPVSTGATVLQAGSTVTSVTYKQADLTTASGTGATTTIQAQNETGATSTGGTLNLTSGTGTSTHGTVNLQVGGITTASIVTNKFVFNKGRRRNVTQISSTGGTYTVLATDDYVAIKTLTNSFTINLPTSPVLGDTYEIKDTTGNASPTVVVTVSGNGSNIDGSASITLSASYASVVVTYTGTQWSIT